MLAAGVGPVCSSYRASSRVSSSIGLRVVVDAQVERDVRRAAEAGVGRGDAQRRRLPAATIAPGLVAGAQGVEQAVGERPLALLEGSAHRIDHAGPGQQIALGGVAATRATAGPGQAGRTRVARRAPAGVDDADLPLVPCRGRLRSADRASRARSSRSRSATSPCGP